MSDFCVDFIFVGRSKNEDAEKLFRHYGAELATMVTSSIITTPDVELTRHSSPTTGRKTEGELVLKQIVQSDYVVLIAQGGSKYTSMQFAEWTKQRKQRGGRCVFVSAGRYGFSEELIARADEIITLCPMTMDRSVERIVALEQVYRAFTILKNQTYHIEMGI